LAQDKLKAKERLEKERIEKEAQLLSEKHKAEIASKEATRLRSEEAARQEAIEAATQAQEVQPQAQEAPVRSTVMEYTHTLTIAPLQPVYNVTGVTNVINVTPSSDVFSPFMERPTRRTTGATLGNMADIRRFIDAQPEANEYQPIGRHAARPPLHDFLSQIPVLPSAMQPPPQTRYDLSLTPGRVASLAVQSPRLALPEPSEKEESERFQEVDDEEKDMQRLASRKALTPDDPDAIYEDPDKKEL
jgi:hypothetical protein